MDIYTCPYFSDRYHTITGLGEGGSGRVYLAKDIHLGQFVAVKFTLKNDMAGVEALEREREALCRIRHKGIPRVLDYGEAVEGFYMVMDLIEGRSFEQLVDEKYLTGSMLIDFALQLGEIIIYLHEECDPPIVHGDIKPANLILDRKGRIHLIDFGTSGTSGADCVRGTVGFAAPEQYAAGGGLISTASDIYAFGATFLYLADKTDLPLGFRRILYKCIKRDPKKRWKSVKRLTKTIKITSFINVKKV